MKPQILYHFSLHICRFLDFRTNSPIQRVSRLRDILTGRVLKTFQDSSEADKSFDTFKEKLLLSQILTAEHYCQEFIMIGPPDDRSFLTLFPQSGRYMIYGLSCHMSITIKFWTI